MARHGRPKVHPAPAALVAALLLGAGCVRDGGGIPFRPPASQAPQPDLVDRVRARLPELKPGLTAEEVKHILRDLPLGEKTVVSLTISGGETVRYQLSPRHSLELEFIPQGLMDPPPGRLVAATLTD